MKKEKNRQPDPFWTSRSNEDEYKQVQAGIELFRQIVEGEETEIEKALLDDIEESVFQGKYSDPKKRVSERSAKSVWKKISRQYGFKRTSLVSLSDKENQKRVGLTINYRYVTLAAVILLLMVSRIFLFTDEEQNGSTSEIEKVLTRTIVQTGRGEIKKLRLMDGSIVFLNGESQLSLIQQEFDKERREVWLEEGEAFFDVAKNPDRPFIIHSLNLKTTVRGTAFNIQAYKALESCVISVKNGKVEVSGPQDETSHLLTRDKRLTYRLDNKQYEIQDVSWQDAAGWIDGNLILNNADIKELKLRLMQHFKCEVAIKGELLEGIIFNSTFSKGTTLTEVLKTLSAIYGVNYKVNKEQVLLYD